MNEGVKSRFMPQASCDYLVSLALFTALYFTALLSIVFRLNLLDQAMLVLHLAQMGHPWIRRHCNRNDNKDSM